MTSLRSPSRQRRPRSLRVLPHALAAVLLAATAACGVARGASPTDDPTPETVPTHALPAIHGREIATLTAPPQVPPPLTRRHATTVVVTLEIVEKTIRLADGVQYAAWTFGGTIPGPFIRVREGDQVELHLQNRPGNTMPHNIDIHAVTGPGGGAEATIVLPGQHASLAFRALNPGLYVYHCAMSPAPVHIANGMYGLLLVEPRDGLPPVDLEFYVMQSEFYPTDTGTVRTLDVHRATDERPRYVVFNGSVGALTGDHALRAHAGETIRLYVGNAGPNLVSSFHVVGEIFDNVYQEGGTVVTTHNVQTTLIPAGGAAMVEFRAETPSTLVLVDHAIFRAFTKGALGMLRIEGPANPEIFSATPTPTPYTPAH